MSGFASPNFQPTPELEDPPVNGLYGQHSIHNPNRRNMSTCQNCGLAFMWDGLRWLPISRNQHLRICTGKVVILNGTCSLKQRQNQEVRQFVLG